MKCNEFEKVVKDALLSYFGGEVQIVEEKGGCLAVLPFLRPDNDFIEILIQERGDELRLSDRGGTFEYLFFSGVDFKKGVNNKKIIEGITSNFKVKTDYEELWKYSKTENLGQDIFNLVQTIQSISHLTYRQKALPERDFHKIVKAQLDRQETKFDENPKVTGYSAIHAIDFHVRVNGSHYYMDTIYASDRGMAKRNAKFTAFKWHELKQANVINGKFKSISVIDDTIEDVWDETCIHILENYSNYTFKWTTDKKALFEDLFSPSQTLD